MKSLSSRALALTVPLSMFCGTAMADLTPTEVWGDWRDYLQSMGYSLNASESVSGGDLTVSDITLSYAMPDDGSMAVDLGTILFQQNRDGTVAIVLPDAMPITITGRDANAGGEMTTMVMNYLQAGQTLTASGDLQEMTYLYKADTVAMTLEDMQVGDKTVGRDEARIAFSGSNVSATTTMTVAEARGYSQSGSVEGASFDIFFVDQEVATTRAAIKGDMSGITFDGTGTIPLDMPEGADMAQMLAAGFDVLGSFAYTSGSSTVDVADPESGNYVMSTSSDGGTLAVKMAPDGLGYSGQQQNVKVGVTVEGMPFPFEIAMAKSGFNLQMPVSQSEEPQDFAFGLTLGDFTMSDIIWSTFDPTGQLPRDPATIMLDLAGKARLLVDWLNPEAASQMTGPPGQLEALTLNTIVVDAAGARLDGSGAVTIDTAGAPLVPGVGTPVGEVNLALSGGNALLDKLVAMGLLPQDQAMGARMMMGLFAVPGDAPDTLKSNIQFTEGGQILANGQRIR